MKILLANSFLVNVSPPASTVTKDAGPVKTHISSKLMFFLGRLRTLDKLDKIINELDGSYDKLSHMQAEGNTTGFTEELLWPDLTMAIFSEFNSQSEVGKCRTPKTKPRLSGKIDAVFKELTKSKLSTILFESN